MSETLSFLHDGTIGDVWARLPALKEYHKQTGKKCVYYLTNGQTVDYYPGATHPTRDENNKMVMLNPEMIDMIVPLLKAQPYIADAKIHEDEKIDVDLNRIRTSFVNQPYGMLSRWYFYVYPDLACDLSKEYIFIPETEKDFVKGKIIIARTERYNNNFVDYSFLKEYEDDLVFSGTIREYNNFCMNFDLNIKKLHVNNFLELAQAIKQSKGLISNQTQIFQIAEGLKTPRAVELCNYAPNVVPIGENAFDFYAQIGLECYFHKLNGTWEKYKEMHILKNPAVKDEVVVDKQVD